jgi:5-methylcytosine-specific restriction protein A
MITRPNRRTGQYIECFTCGIKTYKTKSRIKRYLRHYCSKKCMDNSPYKIKVSSERMKNNNPIFNPIIKEKILKSIQIYWKNNKSYNYIDGSSRNRKYTKNKWIKFVKDIYKRDNWTCQNCGKHGGLLNGHHILPWAGNPEGAFDPNNVITLCVSCHNKIHRGKIKL